MGKKKLTLTDLKVKSYTAQIDEKEQKQIKGGFVNTKNKGVVIVRWTALDNRTKLQTKSSTD